MSDYKLDMNQRIDVEEVLKDLESYRPRRRGWVWREKAPSRWATTRTFSSPTAIFAPKSPSSVEKSYKKKPPEHAQVAFLIIPAIPTVARR